MSKEWRSRIPGLSSFGDTSPTFRRWLDDGLDPSGVDASKEQEENSPYCMLLSILEYFICTRPRSDPPISDQTAREKGIGEDMVTF